MNRPHVAVIGAGLAGLAAALACADDGARVTLLERRNRLGGLTWSFQHHGFSVDNGQHVFLRCCRNYLTFLDRIGAAGDIEMPARMDIPVVAPAHRAGAAPTVGRLRRSSWPAPMHLAGALLRYPHLNRADRFRLGRAVAGLRRLDLADPDLDQQSFGAWLAAHGQSPEAVAAVWDLITVPTVNLPAEEASLAMAATVFKTGLLSQADAADMGWSRVPLSRLHGEMAAAALARSGVTVHTGRRVHTVESVGDGSFNARLDGGATLSADAVVVALPHPESTSVLPPGTLRHQDRLSELGSSAIVDVHLVYDRRVTPWSFMAAVGSPVQWVFDRTGSSGLEGQQPGLQYLAASMSAADALLGERPEHLIQRISAELARLLPAAGSARLVDSLVTKEPRATFRARAGSGALRPPAATTRPGLAVAGAWTSTGWPATMEGAVRSGQAAARACLADIRRRPKITAAVHNTEEVA